MGNAESEQSTAREPSAPPENLKPVPSAPPLPSNLYPQITPYAQAGPSKPSPDPGGGQAPPCKADPAGAYPQSYYGPPGAPPAPPGAVLPPPAAAAAAGPQPIMAYPVQVAPPGAMGPVTAGLPQMVPGTFPVMVADGPVLSPAWVFPHPFRWVLQDDVWLGGSRDLVFKDAYGRDVIRAITKRFSFHTDIDFFDMAGNKACRIVNRLFSFGSTFKICNAADHTVMVQRRDVFNWPGTSTSRVFRGNAQFNAFGNPDVPMAYPEVYRVTGLSPGNSFNVKNSATQCVVATFNRSLFSGPGQHSTAVECAPGVDALLMLAVAVVVAHEAGK